MQTTSGRTLGLAWIAWTLLLVLVARLTWRALVGDDAIRFVLLPYPTWIPDSSELVVPLLILVAYAPMLVVSALWLWQRRRNRVRHSRRAG